MGKYFKTIKESHSFYSFMGLLVIFIAAMLLIPNFRTATNGMTILRQASVLMILSCGLTAVVLTGNIDLSVGSTAALAGCICARLLKEGFPIWAVVIFGVLIGAIVGLFNGFLVSYIKLPSFIATYGTNWVVSGLSIIVMHGTIIYDLPAGFTWLGVGYVGPVPIVVILALVIIAIMYFVLERTVFGRNLYFYGSNAVAARYSGISTGWVLVCSFVLSGMCAGFGGLIISARLNAAEAAMSAAYGLQTTAAVVVGGTSMLGGEGGVLGTIIGAIMLTTITNIMNLVGISSDAQPLVVGLLIIGMVLYDINRRGKKWSQRTRKRRHPMGKKVAVIGCLDTKYEEIQYLKNGITALGLEACVIDTSLRTHDRMQETFFSNKELLNRCGHSLDDICNASKFDALQIMTSCVEDLIPKLYSRGEIDGVISAGGLQNSMLASAGMRKLPFGVPKVLISSMACGTNTFELLTGRSDIVVFPSVADIVGVNFTTKKVFDHAIASVHAMVMGNYRGEPVPKSRGNVGITCTGVTFKGSYFAGELLREEGFEPCFFHGTTGGGYAMEDFVQQGKISGVLDLMIHDVLVEAIGYYVLSHPGVKRLERLAEMDIPTVFSLSGMDAIDMPMGFYLQQKQANLRKRKCLRHSFDTIHVKVSADEMMVAGKLLVDKLNCFNRNVTVILPHKGFRADTQPGGELYDYEIDKILIDCLHEHCADHVRLVDVDCNANDKEYSRTVVREFLELL